LTALAALYFVTKEENELDYQAMYLKLFNAVTDAIKTLQTAQVATEEMYIDHNPGITLLNPRLQG